MIIFSFKISDQTISLSILPIISVFLGEKFGILLKRKNSQKQKIKLNFDFEIWLFNRIGIITVILMYIGLIIVFGKEFYNILDQVKLHA